MFDIEYLQIIPKYLRIILFADIIESINEYVILKF